MRILVIGGYGAFGTRIVRRLKRIHNLEVLVGGRNASKADVVLDITKRENLMKNLSELKPHLVIHTAGPFNNSEDYAVARACLAVSSTGHKCHYLDLADNSEYVMGFGILDEEARKKGCLLVTGASTTPAVTTTVVSHHCPNFFSSSVASSHASNSPRNSFTNNDNFISKFTKLQAIDINLSVANSSMPGEGTVKSVLSYCGKPIRSIQGGKECDVHGWKSLSTQRFPGMTTSRWCSDVLVPDVDVFTAHISPPRRSQYVFPKVISTTHNALKEFRFRAGVESSLSMIGLAIFSSMKQIGLPGSIVLENFSSSLIQLNRALNLFSSGKGQGGMTVNLMGTARTASGDKVNRTLRWGLSANADTGPEIPCTPALVIASKLNHMHKYRNAHVSAASVESPQYRPGARVCADMISMHDFTDAIQQDELDIQQYVAYGRDNLSEQQADYSATFTALDHLSQTLLPDPVCAVHAEGGIVTGDLLVTMSRFPFVRLASKIVGLPVPNMLSKQKSFKFLVNMSESKWLRLCVPVDRTDGEASAINIFASTFSNRNDDQLLTESLLGGFLQYSMQQKAATHLREVPARVSLGERPWVYDGFQGVCVKSTLLYGYIPLPSWLRPSPYCLTTPHSDGLGWDLLVTLSMPLLGEVIRYEGPMRIAALKGSHSSKQLSSRNREELKVAMQSAYGTNAPGIPMQKIIGKYLLIYDSECVICDASVSSLIEKDTDNLVMFSSIHDRKSQNILSELGFDESRFAAEKDQTIFLITPFGEILTHSDALLALLKVLPGSQHAALHALLAVIPNFLRNRVYGYVAENRHTLLGQASPTSQGANTASECTVLSSRPTAEQDRFL